MRARRCLTRFATEGLARGERLMASSRSLRVATALITIIGLTVIATALVAPAKRANAEAIAVRDGYSLRLVQSGFTKPEAIRFSPAGRLFLLEPEVSVKIV